MVDISKVVVGSILELKKSHPCGSFKWKVLRTGIDFKMECIGCGRQISIPRIDVEKRIKKIVEE